MDAIRFIEADLAKARVARGLGWILAAGACLLPIALGVGLRGNMAGFFSLRTLLPNTAAALLLGWAAARIVRPPFRSGNAFRGAASALSLALLLATERIFFPPGERTSYASAEDFWRESAHCFSLGMLTVVLLSVGIGFLIYRFFPWPARRWRFLLSALAGTSAAVMLGFHCDSSSVGHVIAGHVAPGIAVGLLFFGVQEIYFRFALVKRLPELGDKLRNPERIG